MKWSLIDEWGLEIKVLPENEIARRFCRTISVELGSEKTICCPKIDNLRDT